MQLCRSIPMMNTFLKMWHYIHRQLTSLSLWPSPPMSINGYLWIVDEAWWNVWGGGGEGGGGNLMMGWHLIQEVVAIPLVASCRANWNKLWLNSPSWLKYRLCLLLPEKDCGQWQNSCFDKLGDGLSLLLRHGQIFNHTGLRNNVIDKVRFYF